MAEMMLEAVTPFSALLAKLGGPGAPGAAPIATPGLHVRERAGLYVHERTGLFVRERTGLGLATVIARKGARSALGEAVRGQWGVDLVDGPAASGHGRIAFIGVAPGSWLAVAPGGGWRFASDLAKRLDGLASVSDQSSGYGVLRLSGPSVRAVLAKGAPLDLHPTAFPPGAAAVTDIAHVGGIIWRVDGSPLADGADDAAGVFDVAVFRSLAGSFWHWLEDSAAEFGMSAG